MLSTEEANVLYWKIVWTIEPALYDHAVPINEPIQEKAFRMTLEAMAKGKAKAIMGELQDMKLAPLFVPSPYPPAI